MTHYAKESVALDIDHWHKVEEFLRDYMREFRRVGDYAAALSRVPSRVLTLEVHGPGMLLEISGLERRMGVIGTGTTLVPLMGGRQRILVLRDDTIDVYLKLYHPGEGGADTSEFAVDLPPATHERMRLERLIREVLDHALQPVANAEPWEEQASRMRFALEALGSIQRAARRVRMERAIKSSSGMRVFQRAIDEITKSYHEPIRLIKFAKSMGMSARNFARMIHAWSGTTFTEHLLMVRLMNARRMLVTGGESIEEISRSVGFGGRDHFIRSFRQYFGWTPLQYRKHWRRALEGRGNWAELLEMPGRAPVEWKKDAAGQRSPLGEGNFFHTLVVANATREVRVIQRVEADGAALAKGALQPGQAEYFHSDVHGSLWRVLDAQGVVMSFFNTPDRGAQAVILS